MKRTEKRYPFSLRKHAHDLAFRRHRAMNELSDKFFNHTLKDGEEARYQKLIDDIGGIMDYFPDGNGIIWLTGKEYGLAKESVAWAESMRG